MRARRGLRLGGLGVAMVLLAAGCGTGDGSSVSSTPATAPDTAATTPAMTPTTPEGFGFGPVTAPADPPGGGAIAVGVTAQGDPNGRDVVSFDFTPGEPACLAEYVDPPVRDAVTDRMVEVAGDAFLRVSCSGVATLQFTTAKSWPVAPHFDIQLGRFRVPGGTTRNVVEVVQTGYDGQTLTWTIGLRHRAPMSMALSLQGPIASPLVVVMP